MKERIDLKILKDELSLRIREFYPYFLGFYILSLVVAIFSLTWRTFFYWPAFHGAFIIFSVLFLLTIKFNFHLNFKFQWNLRLGERSLPWRNLAIQFFRFLVSLAGQFFQIVWRLVRAASLFIYKKIVALSLKVKLKILVIIVVLAFALFRSIGVLDFLVLAYALVSVLFVIESRLAAGAALILLAACPVFLILKKDTLAESAAVYAYYFLVITVLTQFRELKREKSQEKSAE